MSRFPSSRRTFIKTSAAATAGVMLSARSWAKVPGANDDVRVAVVGLNNRGEKHLKGYLEAKGVRIAAICDVDTAVLDRADAFLRESGVGAKKFVDLRDVLARDDIDAVSIATPNHLHSLQSIWACQAGKDVYVDKPVSHNIWEGRQLVAAGSKYGRVIQGGTQSRSTRSIADAIAWMQAGNIGKVTSVRGLCYKRRPSIGLTNGPQPVPKTVNYDLWCGPAPLVPPHRKEFHYDWHWFWAYGNGDLGNQGCHQMDIARRFLGEPGIARHAMSIGGRLGYEDDGQTPNTQVVVYDYERAPLIFEIRGLPATAGEEKMGEYRGVSIGVIADCEKGSILVDKNGTRAVDRSGNVLQKFSGGEQHFQNFVDVIRSRRMEDLRGPILEAHISTALSHTANISHRLGHESTPGETAEKIKGNAALSEAYGRMVEHLRVNGVDLGRTPATLGVPLVFDPAAERFVGNPRADEFLTRDYRAPFVVPKLAQS